MVNYLFLKDESMRYCFFFPYGGIDRYIFKDVIDLNNVRTVFLNKSDISGPKALLKRIHRSESVNAYINLPLKHIWDDWTYINNILQDCECLVFTSTALVYLDIKLLKSIKNKGHKMVLIIYDSLSGNSHHLKAVKNCIHAFSWDVVLSFDASDCQKFGFTSIDFAMYSYLKENRSDNCSDIYFIGKNKAGRNIEIKRLYEVLHNSGVVCDFHIKEIDRLHKKREDVWDAGMHIFYNRNIPYEEVIKDVLSTNVILEYLHEGQQAQSLRYYEAVCYNKKLLTNNRNISKLPFYNPQYMKLFSLAEDINVEWIKKREKINYGYNREFSPVRILKIIESKL